jgi:hypothetical protein
MEIVRITKQELLEDRRGDRASRRLFRKHYGRRCLEGLWELLLVYTHCIAELATVKHYFRRAKNIKLTVLIAKFCNALIGVSLTDSLPALAIN